MAKFKQVSVKQPSGIPQGNKDIIDQSSRGSNRSKTTQEVGNIRSKNYVPDKQGWDLNEKRAFFKELIGSTIKTASTGKRVEMSDDEIRIYKQDGTLVATLSGTEIAGIASAMTAIFGVFNAIGLQEDAIGDPFALGTDLDGAVMMDVGDVAISARKSAGGGGGIKLIPDIGTGDKVKIYQYMQLVPQASPPASGSKGDMYFNTDGKLYVHNGSSWVVAGTQS